jgi:hypothetical protein
VSKLCVPISDSTDAGVEIIHSKLYKKKYILPLNKITFMMYGKTKSGITTNANPG